MVEDLARAFATLNEIAEDPWRSRELEAQQAEALRIVLGAGAHPISCESFDRVARWPAGMNAGRTLAYHLEQMKRAIAGEDVTKPCTKEMGNG